MMELIVAILIALGALTTERDFTSAYKEQHVREVSTAQLIIDHGQYRINEDTGGVLVDPGVGL